MAEHMETETAEDIHSGDPPLSLGLVARWEFQQTWL